MATDLVKYLLSSFDVNPGRDWKIYFLLTLSMWMVQGWKMQHIGTVSVLGVMDFDMCY